MMKGFLYLFLIGMASSLAATESTAAVFSASNDKVTMEKGDTLSDALHQHFPHRKWKLWGKSGVIRKIAELNPQYTKKGLDLLFPGKVVELGSIVGGQAQAEPQPERNPTSVGEPIVQGPIVPVVVESPIPAPQASPAPVCVSKVEPPLPPLRATRFSYFTLAPEFYYSLIQSTDLSNKSSAKIPSNLNEGLRLSWGQVWSESFRTSIDVGIDRESYTLQESARDLKNGNHNATDIGFHTRVNPNGSDYSLLGSLSFRQETFLRANSLTSLTMDQVLIPQLSIGISAPLFKLDNFTLRAQAEGFLLLPGVASTYTISSGSGYDIGFSILEGVSKSFSMSGGLSYLNQSQKTSISSEALTELRGNIGFTFYFDPVTKPEEAHLQ